MNRNCLRSAHQFRSSNLRPGHSTDRLHPGTYFLQGRWWLLQHSKARKFPSQSLRLLRLYGAGRAWELWASVLLVAMPVQRQEACRDAARYRKPPHQDWFGHLASVQGLFTDLCAGPVFCQPCRPCLCGGAATRLNKVALQLCQERLRDWKVGAFSLDTPSPATID